MQMQAYKSITFGARQRKQNTAGSDYTNKMM